MEKKGPTSEEIEKYLDDFKKRPADKDYIKRRVRLDECCKDRKRPQNSRAKYATSGCDSYSLSYRLPLIISNNLFQYIADAKPRIVREDWDIIEKHAQAIQDYAEADPWDNMPKPETKEDKKRKSEYLKKDKAFKEAMTWLQNNLQGLWW